MVRRLAALWLLLAACSTAAPETTTSSTTIAPPSPSTTSDAPAPPLSSSTTSISTTSTTTATSTPTPTTLAPTDVTSPGLYDAQRLRVRIRFESRVDAVTSEQLADQALAILNDASGWGQSGFTFAGDESSELVVVLAEGDLVDELCMPLDTYGKVSCQNGAVVALNADRWRMAGDDWDATIESYRAYLINHEVGHLIGLRHPVERCPTDSKISALMEPQTNNLLDCVGNGIPLSWEIEWAKQRPAFVGPGPEWDGPRPSWPQGD